jgi:hypothetical protein
VTEAEWPKSGAPGAMLEHCWSGASPRKKRLFGCACCSRAAHLMTASAHAAIATAEAFADDAVTAGALAEALRGALASPANGLCHYLCAPHPDAMRQAWSGAANQLLLAGSKWHAELSAIADLIRDVFGNPFRPVEFAPDWRTDTAVSLARQMYESREFSAMPILADALQDAGCDSDDVLTHCRDAKQPHVRGCWVVDSLLEKA